MPRSTCVFGVYKGRLTGGKKKRQVCFTFQAFGVYFGVKLCLVGTVYISNKNRHNL